MGELQDRVKARLVARRQRVLDGKFNCIPSPFTRFNEDFPGLQEAFYLCVTSFTKGGKTQFTLNLLFEALMFAFEHPQALRLKIFYFILEETDEGILLRFESWLLFRLDNIIISPKDLNSTYADRPLSQEIIDKLSSDKYRQYIDFFESVFVFSTVGNPTGIYKDCKQYAEANGKVFYKEYDTVDTLGNPTTGKSFDHYEPNDPNEVKVVVVDHISLVDTERGMTKKETLDKLSGDYFAKYLRNRYKFCIITIQQQSAEVESNDSFKLGRIRPSSSGLSDSKYIGRDCNMLLGLFSPYKFGLREYGGYDITRFKDHIRFLEVCLNRDGDVGGMIALYFNGANSTFFELPPANDAIRMKEIYDYLDTLDNSKKKRGLLAFISKVKHKLTKANG